MLSLLSSRVHVPLQPGHRCHSALPSHISSHGDFTTSSSACSILIEFCEKFSNTKLKSASWRLLPHLDYHMKRSRVCNAGTWFSEKRTRHDSTANEYDTTSHFFSQILPSKSPTSPDILGFLYIRLNYIKLLCLWVKSSWVSVVSYGLI